MPKTPWQKNTFKERTGIDMARPRKTMAVSTGKIGKAAREKRKNEEKKYKLTRDALSPPMWLDTKAKKEFKRVVAECEKIDILDNLDLAVLAIYANAYSHFVDCCDYINRNGETIEKISRYGAYEVTSPYIAAQEKYVKQIMLCSSKLGLATTDRLKLIVPVVDDESEENKFKKYLA